MHISNALQFTAWIVALTLRLFGADPMSDEIVAQAIRFFIAVMSDCD